jgi:hypothetical protein
LKGSSKKKWRKKQRETEEKILRVLRKFYKFKKERMRHPIIYKKKPNKKR